MCSWLEATRNMSTVLSATGGSLLRIFSNTLLTLRHKITSVGAKNVMAHTWLVGAAVVGQET